ncbi:MAG: hypothetical protein JW967_10780, partial [Dehalococcoidales bacterium]|nr:hypothetical protein [Dehalococcoidales bacterium]
MPKKISIVQKREWLNSYEQGKSEADIAKKAHHDVKTIKSGIEEVRRERDAQLARAELLRDALRKHQDQMLNCIEGIFEALELPPVNLSVDMPVSLRGAKIEFKAVKGLVLTLRTEEKPEWALLEEHLGKRDRLWKAIGNWKQTMTDHIHLRRQLYRELERQLIDKGYRIVDGKETAPFLYRDTVWLLYRDMVSKTLEKG